MATRKVTLTGIAMWAKVFEANRDMKGFENAYEEHDGACTIELILGDEEFAKLKAAGSIKKGSKTEEGNTKVKLVRKWKDRFDWASGAPEVVDADDNEWTLDGQGMIPNHSTVEVEVSVYDTSRPSIKGTRLDKVKVLAKAEMEEEEKEELPF